MVEIGDNTSRDAIARRLRATRKTTGRNQRQFSEWLGIAAPTWNNYEKAYRRIDLEKAFLVVRATGVTLDWIYFGERSGLPLHLAEQLDQHLEDAA